MKVLGVSLRNLIVASLFPGMLAAVFGVAFLGYWALALGVAYSVVYFFVYWLTQELLGKRNLSNSILANLAASALIPFAMAYIAMALFGVSNSFSAACFFAILGLVGGFYLGYLNKTS